VLAITVQELTAVVLAVIALGVLGFYRMWCDNANLRERIARLEESVRSLLNTSRKED
jgi:succinate dehydrogenase hydrophobic anchor subunit